MSFKEVQKMRCLNTALTGLSGFAYKINQWKM
jgi:hypothetical protein